MRLARIPAALILAGALAAATQAEDDPKQKARDFRPEEPASAADAPPPRAGGGKGGLALEATWRDGLRLTSADQAIEIQIGGRIHYDWAWIQEDRDLERTPAIGDQRDGTQFRRARLSVKGVLREHVEFQAAYEFAVAGTAFRNVWGGLRKLGGVGTLRAGHMKEPFGLEELTSANYITFIERGLESVFVPAFNSGALGLVAVPGGLGTVAGGVFRTTPDTATQSGDGEYAATGRATACPLYLDDGALALHLGASATRRHPPLDTVTFAARPEVNLAGIFVTTPGLPTVRVDAYGVEAALVAGPFSVQGEWVWAYVDTVASTANRHFGGGYVQASVFLTGERRPYQRAPGPFGKPKLATGVWDDARPGPGAVELAVRVSTLDLTDGAVRGGELRDCTVGASWYADPNLRVMVNYVYIDRRSIGRAHALVVRLQLEI